MVAHLPFVSGPPSSYTVADVRRVERHIRSFLGNRRILAKKAPARLGFPPSPAFLSDTLVRDILGFPP